MNPHDPKGAAGKLKCPLHLIPTAALESEAWVLQPTRHPLVKDLVGQTFGRLKVVRYAGNQKHPNGRTSSTWACECSCGKQVEILGNNLKKGNSSSCGCLRGSHHSVNTPEYVAWGSINQRCNNPKNPGYKNYGARGIQMCERWGVFQNFLEDMGLRPSPKHSIDRTDNDGNYAPCNCKWVTGKTQHRNKRSNRLLTIKGVTRCMTEWAEIAGVSFGGLSKRVKNGWGDDVILSHPMPRCEWVVANREGTIR